MTQVPWLGETARPPAMSGTETLVMVVSSTTMKLESASRLPANHRDAPLMGEKSPLGAVLPLAAVGLAMTTAPDQRCATSMSVYIDRPTRSGFARSSAGSSAMRTGRRCTILIQLPVAF